MRKICVFASLAAYLAVIAMPFFLASPAQAQRGERAKYICKSGRYVQVAERAVLVDANVRKGGVLLSSGLKTHRYRLARLVMTPSAA
jgi:hypothetical protein